MSSNQSIEERPSRVAAELRAERFGRLLGGAFRRWRRHVDDELRPLGFTDATRGPLVGLYDNNGPMRQGDLARYMVLDASALVRVIQMLEERGLVSCAPDPADRRGKLVTLTPLGTQWAERIIDRSYELELQALASISREDIATTRRVLAQIADAIPDG